MYAKFLRRFVHTLTYSKRLHVVTLILTVLCAYKLLNNYVQESNTIYSEVTSRKLTYSDVTSRNHTYSEVKTINITHSEVTTRNDESVYVDKFGIFVSCSYNDNKNSLSSTLAQLSALSLSISKTMETEFEYEIYFGVESDVKIEQYLKFNETERRYINFLPIAKSFYSNTINELTKHAIDKNLDYFAILQFDALLKWKYWTIRAVRSLKGHCPSDFGVVVQDCNESNQVVIVSRKHMELSGNFFPPDLKMHEATKWLLNIYLPNHVSALNSKGETACTADGNQTLTLSQGFNHTRLQQEMMREESTCVVSYSLYGTQNRYIDGVLENANLTKIIYPGWKMWVYHDSTVPLSLLVRLCDQKHVRCINMTGTMIRNRRSWRFLVASAKNVSKYIIRDIDSRLSMREKAAVNEWLHSGKHFHVMRDHPLQNHVINAGMWGGSADKLESISLQLLKRNPDDNYISDTRFLQANVWPILKKSVLQHDSYFCVKYGGQPFPTLRNGGEHVGGIYFNGIINKNNARMVKNRKEPKACSTSINLLEEL